MRRWRDPIGLPFGVVGNGAGGGSRYATEVLADNPAGYWRLGEANGAVTGVDASANGNDGTYNGVPTLEQVGALTGDPNTAALWPTVADFLLIPDHPTLDFGDGPWSVEMWLTGRAGYCLSKANQFTFRFIANELAIDNDTVVVFQQTVATPDDNYHHWVITRTGPGVGNTIFYLDGAAIAITAVNPAAVFANNATALNIGRYSGGVVGYAFRMDEVAVYDHVLTPARVAAHFAASQ